MSRAWLLILLIVGFPIAAADCSRAPIKRVFLQPQTRDLERTEAQWQRQVRLLRDSGIRSVYLQWTRHADVNFLHQRVAGGQAFLPMFAALSQSHQLSLYIGLFADPNWFERTSVDGPRKMYLAHVRKMSLEQAAEITRQLNGTNLAGWYLPEEINDRDWKTPTHQAELFRHLETMTEALQALTPGKMVSISSYAGGDMSPRDFAELWGELLQIESLELWFQDGSGTQSLELNQRIAYRRHLEARLDPSDWGLIVELFHQDKTQGNEFVAHPVTGKTLAERIRGSTTSSEILSLNAFSWRYLFTEDEQLLDGYRSIYCSMRGLPGKNPEQASAPP